MKKYEKNMKNTSCADIATKLRYVTNIWMSHFYTKHRGHWMAFKGINMTLTLE